jgi:hypothetical protein
VKVKNAKLRAARYFALRGGDSMAVRATALFDFHPSGCAQRMIN